MFNFHEGLNSKDSSSINSDKRHQPTPVTTPPFLLQLGKREQNLIGST